MEKTIHYKDHVITLNGIVATIHTKDVHYNVRTEKYDHGYIYKTRFTNASECVKSLKSFINLRLEQQKRDRGVNVYA